MEQQKKVPHLIECRVKVQQRVLKKLFRHLTIQLF